MTSNGAALLGVQEPRLSWLPPSATVFDAAEDALDLADMAHRETLLWQCTMVRSGMAQRDDRAWAAFEVGVLVSRQNGKNGGIEVVELGWMVTEPGVSILHTAHEFQTALESMEKLEALIRSSPKTERLIARNGVRRGNGKESIRFTNGSVIRFRTRTKQGGRGFSVDRLVIDEAMIINPASLAAIMPLLTTAKRPQIWYLGSAADAEVHEHCHKWASLRARALAGGDPSLCWLEWSAPDPPPAADVAARAAWREDRANWAAANPSLGYLLTEDYVENELAAFRTGLDQWEIERLSAGRWPVLDGDGDPLFGDEGLWPTLAYEERPVLQGEIGFGVAMSEDRRWVTFAAAARTTTGRIHVEVGYHEAPDAATADRLVALIVRLDPCCLAIRSKSPAMSLLPALVERGIEPETLTAAQYEQACGAFYDDAVNGLLSQSGDPRLTAAVNGAMTEVPGGVPKPRPGAVVSPLEAATVAHWGLATFGSAMPRSGAPAHEDDGVQVGDELDVMAVAF